MTRERVAEHAPVLGQCIRVGHRSQLVQELGGALDVGEEEGDRAGGKMVSHGRHWLPPVAAAPTQALARLRGAVVTLFPVPGRDNVPLPQSFRRVARTALSLGSSNPARDTV